MTSELTNKQIELNDRRWFDCLSNNNLYTLCSIKIGDSVSKVLTILGNSCEIGEDKSKKYKVYYYCTEEFSKIGFQIIDSHISGFTLINDNRVNLKEIIDRLGEPQTKDIIIGQIFSMMDYEIEANIYNYDEYATKIKLNETEKTILTFYFGDNWGNISLECFPTEIH